MKSSHLREYVIRPTLEYLGLWSPEAEDLLLGTAAQESHMGHYLHQVRGPAVGIYQMEPTTHQDIWEHYLSGKADLGSKVRSLAAYRWKTSFIPTTEMHVNLAYATAMARAFYLRKPGAIPKDLAGWAAYWKQHWNTHLGAGTEEQFVENYRRFVYYEERA